MVSSFGVGAAGIDVFFIISGFIMGAVGVHESPVSFVLKRICRIVPLYWLVTSLMCAGALAGAFTRFTFDAATLFKSLLFIPYFDPSNNIWPLVVPAWTLNVEMLFYAVFAGGLLIGMPLRFAAVALLALVTSGALLHPDSAVLRLWTTPLLLEFFVGLLFATLIRPTGTAVGLGMIFCGVGGLACAELLWRYDEAWRVLAWGVPSAAIVYGALSVEHAGRWPKQSLRWLERIGDASYSLYLTHGLVIAMMHRGFGETMPVNVLALLLALSVGFAFFYGFERPVGSWLAVLRLKRKQVPDKTLPAGVSA